MIQLLRSVAQENEAPAMCVLTLLMKLKKNNESNKIVRFWQGLGKSIMASLREFALYFFLFSLFNCFDHFIGMLDYSVGWSMLSCNYGVDGQRRIAFPDIKLFFSTSIAT